MRKILTLLGVVAVLLLMPTNAKAWGDLYLLNNIWGSWGPADTNSDYKFTKVNDSEFTYTLDASNHSGDIYWRINTPSDYDGKREIRPDNDGQEVGVSGYNAKYDESYSDKSFKISHSTNNYTHYTITVRWDTGGGGFWNVKVEGSGSKVYTSSVYLLGTINSWSGTDYPVVYQGQGGSEWKLSLTKAQVEGALWQGDFYFRFIENMNTGTQYGVYPNVDQTSLTVGGSYNSDTYATTNTTTDDKKDYYWKFTPTGADNYNIYFNHDGDTRSVKVTDDRPIWYLHSNLGGADHWTDDTPYALIYNPASGYYERTLTQSEISGAKDGDVRFRIYDGTNSWGPQVSSYVFDDTGSESYTSTTNSTGNYFSIPKDFISAKIEAKQVTGGS